MFCGYLTPFFFENNLFVISILNYLIFNQAPLQFKPLQFKNQIISRIKFLNAGIVL